MSAVVESMVTCFNSYDIATNYATAARDSFGIEQLLDDTLWGAMLEGFVALAVFAICLLFLHVFGCGDGRRKRTKLKKLQKASETNLGSRSAVTDRCRAAEPAVALQHDSHSLDALCAMVRAGRLDACFLMRLDKCFEQAIRNRCDVPQDHLITNYLVTVLRSCASAHRYHDALVAYDHCSYQVKTGETTLWSLLMYIAVEADRCDLGITFFGRLCKVGYPNSQDFINLVRCYVRLRDSDGLRNTMADLHRRGCAFDNVTRNKAIAACMQKGVSFPKFAEVVAKYGSLDAVGYNTMMKLYAKSRCLNRCLELREQMRKNGVKASEVTFGILLDACVSAGDSETAKRVFAELRDSGVRLNVVHWTNLIKGLIAGGWLSEADSMLDEMLSRPGTKPDLITYSTLVKAHAEQGNVGAALRLLAKMYEQGVRPDEIVFNNVIAGCSVVPVNSVVTLHTFDTLLKYGLKPSTMTLSLLLKAFLLSKAWGSAFDLLAKCPQRFHVEPEIRLYVQIVQAAMRAKNSSVTEEAFEALLDAASLRGETLDTMMLSRLLQTCASSCNRRAVLRIRSLLNHPTRLQ
jgi:pentatricopeptide repeat protein